jgi:hypothetical protein
LANVKDVHLARGFLNVAAAKSKTAARRLIKMEPNLIAWLSPFAGRYWQIFPAPEAGGPAIVNLLSLF